MVRILLLLAFRVAFLLFEAGLEALAHWLHSTSTPPRPAPRAAARGRSRRHVDR